MRVVDEGNPVHRDHISSVVFFFIADDHYGGQQEQWSP